MYMYIRYMSTTCAGRLAVESLLNSKYIFIYHIHNNITNILIVGKARRARRRRMFAACDFKTKASSSTSTPIRFVVVAALLCSASTHNNKICNLFCANGMNTHTHTHIVLLYTYLKIHKVKSLQYIDREKRKIIISI